MRSNLRRWAVGGVVASLVVGLGLNVAPTPARADDTVVIDATDLHGKLFAAKARAHAQDEFSAAKMVALTGELTAWRTANPSATAQQLRDHVTAVSGSLEAKLKPGDATQAPDRRLLYLLNLLTKDGTATLRSPVMLKVYQVIVGSDTLPLGTIADFTRSSRGQYSLYDSTYTVQDLVLGDLAARAPQDAALTQVWNERFGTPMGVSPLQTTAELGADLEIKKWVDVPALLALTGNPDAFLAEAKRQFAAAMAPLDPKVDGTLMKQELSDLAAADAAAPADVHAATLTDAEKATHQAAANAAQTAAASRQKAIDGVGTAVQTITSMSAKTPGLKWWIDQAIPVGKAGVQIATAINKYIPAVAGLGFAQALFSMSTAVMTGNVLGAISSLLPLFGGGSPEAAMKDQMTKLQDSIKNLASTMNNRFDRVDRALKQIYSEMQTNFDAMLKLQNATLEQLQAIDKKIAELSTAVDMWGSELLSSQRQAQLGVVYDAIDHYLNYPKTHPRAMNSDEYFTVTDNLHSFATNTAANAPFVVPENSAADVLTVLNTWMRTTTDVGDSVGANGAISYLRRYAKTNFGWSDPSITDPDAPLPTPADAASWALAARTYAMLMAQNPDLAKQGNAVRPNHVIAEGEEILSTTRALSAPVNGGTNSLFAGLTDQYKQAAEQFSDRLRTFADKARFGVDGWANIFGTTDQVPASAIPADPASLPNCTAGGAALTKPANVSTAGAPKEAYFVDWAHGDVKTELCQTFNIGNVDTSYDSKWVYTTGDLVANVQLRVVYAKGNVDFPQGKTDIVRSWSASWPLGVYCKQPNGSAAAATGGFCHTIAEYRSEWATKWKPAFEAQASYVDNGAAVRDDVRKKFYVRAEEYYRDVWNDLIAPYNAANGSGTLHALNDTMTRTVRLMQAYSTLGFGRAMEQDQLMPYLLTGGGRPQSDQHDVPEISGTFLHALTNYCPATPCGLTNATYNPMDTQGYLDNTKCTVAAGSAAHKSGDPVGDCMLANQVDRITALRARYDAHSAEIAGGTLQEGMPEIETAVESLRVANAVTPY
ncbi:hypothetical protein [Paractinoplanes globisporus]|uniref:Uncharacterized protein n=1 Tax=Paractinoplanes globisporus TaxID=113565 RepID=A0ABW6WAC4_9ACTN|nr:hypothetical protein [Actinoplanes globisporus]